MNGTVVASTDSLSVIGLSVSSEVSLLIISNQLQKAAHKLGYLFRVMKYFSAEQLPILYKDEIGRPNRIGFPYLEFFTKILPSTRLNSEKSSLFYGTLKPIF